MPTDRETDLPIDPTELSEDQPGPPPPEPESASREAGAASREVRVAAPLRLVPSLLVLAGLVALAVIARPAGAGR